MQDFEALGHCAAWLGPAQRTLVQMCTVAGRASSKAEAATGTTAGLHLHHSVRLGQLCPAPARSDPQRREDGVRGREGGGGGLEHRVGTHLAVQCRIPEMPLCSCLAQCSQCSKQRLAEPGMLLCQCHQCVHTMPLAGPAHLAVRCRAPEMPLRSRAAWPTAASAASKGSLSPACCLAASWYALGPQDAPGRGTARCLASAHRQKASGGVARAVSWDLSGLKTQHGLLSSLCTWVSQTKAPLEQCCFLVCARAPGCLRRQLLPNH